MKNWKVYRSDSGQFQDTWAFALRKATRNAGQDSLGTSRESNHNLRNACQKLCRLSQRPQSFSKRFPIKICCYFLIFSALVTYKPVKTFNI